MKKVLLLIIISILTSPSFAADVIEDNGNGGINWTKGVIFARGFGAAPEDAPKRKKRMLARRAAQVDAYRNLSEIINGVRVTSETLVQDMTLASDSVKTKVEGLVRGATMTSDHYQNDIAEVTLQISIDGSFSGITNQSDKVLQSADATMLEKFQIKIEQLASLVGPQKAHANERLITSAQELSFAKRLLEQAKSIELAEYLKNEIDAYGDTSMFTGLLIDATDVPNFELATIPRIRNEAGDVLYPKTELFEEALSTKRPVSYDFDVDDAINNDRVAINPYIIQAKSTFKSRNSDLVIDEHSASLISGDQRLMDIINQAGVMIVVSP